MRRTTILGWGAAALLAAAPSAALAHGDRHGDDHGDRDAAVATVTAFADGSLTLTLADGSTLVGKVTDRTDIECRRPAAARASRTGQDRHRHRRGRGHDPRHRRGHGFGHRKHRPGKHRHPRACTTAELTAGTAVRDATVRATTAGAVYTEIELDK